MKKRNLCFALALLTGFILTAAVSADSKPEYVIRLGGEHSQTSTLTKCWQDVFIPRVEELTDGKVTVDFYPDGVLGGNAQMAEQTQQGQLNMMYISDVSASLSPDKMNIISLPFLFSSEEHFDEVVDGEIGQKIMSDLPSVGLHPFFFLENGFREMTNNKKPINSLADVNGLKMRVTDSEVMINLFQNLGANTVVMQFSELYSALSTGTVDGQENAYSMIVSSKFYEVQKYVAETNHVMGYFIIVANEDWFSSLPEEYQEAITQAAKETSEYQRKMHREGIEADKQTCLDNGMELTTPDLTEFKEAVQPVYDSFFEKYPDSREIVEEIQALAE